MAKVKNADLKDELQQLIDNNEVGLLITSSDHYQEVNQQVIRFLVGEKQLPGVYVTVNRPASDIQEGLEDDGLDTDNVLFVDAISREVGQEEQEDSNILYLQSPQSLTNISIVISQAMAKLKGQKKFIFFDSLSTLTVYNETDTVSDFAHHLTGRLRTEEVPGIIISLKEKSDEAMTAQLTQFCDRVIRPEEL